MLIDKVSIRNIKSFNSLDVTFNFSNSKIIVITGKNGAEKTTIIKAFNLISDPNVFQKSSGDNAINEKSSAHFTLSDFDSFSFHYQQRLNALDTKDKIPPEAAIISELPIPFGTRFQQFSKIAKYDSELRVNIASNNYENADELKEFLSMVYKTEKFNELKSTRVKKHTFYFLLKKDDYYIREDHFSSGEFFLIQIFRLITSGAKLILIDELDVALDASAQSNLYSSIKPVLKRYNSRLIVISHSLAFMETVDEGALYYLEINAESTSLEQRSFGYIKSDLYGFRGKDRFIITEDDTLACFVEHLIKKHITPFFEYEVIPVGGQPQIKTIAEKNDSHSIFGDPRHLLIIVDKDIHNKIGYRGPSKVARSPVDDIEFFIWLNREELLPNIQLAEFKAAKKQKDTAKTYWRKIISSKQVSKHQLFTLIERHNPEETSTLVGIIRDHLSLQP